MQAVSERLDLQQGSDARCDPEINDSSGFQGDTAFQSPVGTSSTVQSHFTTDR
jgi:hypothetical protein